VIGIDPDPGRRATALSLGMHDALDPKAGSVAETIKAMTNGRGADACIEVSGAPPALAEAIRAVAYSSRVVAMGFFQGEVSGLRLGEEFHHNRVELICSQISGTAPEAMHRWSKPRLWRTAIELQHRGVLDLLPLITHTAPFEQAPDLFARLDAGEPGLLQAMIEFPQ
jgi:threonine dehydrogenase-like Zn-dependent dehydrogenase